MASYYQCAGTVTTMTNDLLQCSSAWQTYTPPTTTTPSTVQMVASGELLTASDTYQLFGFFLLAFALWGVVKIIASIMGIKL